VYLLPTRTAVEEQRQAADVAVLPAGFFEQHGDHLPLSTDAIVAQLIAERLAGAYDLLLLPPITISCSHEHEGLLAGTVSISARTLHTIVSEVATSLARAGVRKLAPVSGHGGNYVLSNVVQEANVTERRMLLYPGSAALDRARVDAGCQTSSHEDMHGGELETSLLLHAAPGVVREGWQRADHDAPERPDLLTVGLAGYTTSGIIGRASLASPDKGEKILASLVSSFGARLAVLRG
jgi:creatinine amidohydrolase